MTFLEGFFFQTFSESGPEGASTFVLIPLINNLMEHQLHYKMEQSNWAKIKTQHLEQIAAKRASW